MTAPIRYDEVVTLSPLVRRLTQNNPGLYSGPGTNTHLVGRSDLVVLDPGEDRGDGHLERIVAAVGKSKVTAVIPSHGHPDHWPLSARLAKAFQAPIWFWQPNREFPVDRTIRDGETIQAGETRLQAIYTPGHLPDHLSFVLENERALFPGDVVMGWSTSIIAPPEGDLVLYLQSLERLLAIPNLTVAYPAHGLEVPDPYGRIRELIAHRLHRSQQVLAALADGPHQIATLVTEIYRDIDAALHPAAALSLEAHLLALEATGRVARTVHGGTTRWRLSS